MKKNIDKLLVLSTLSFFIIVAFIVFWIDFAHPKKIEFNDGLIFGNKNATIKVVVFEDFKCRACKKFSDEVLPSIKQKYIDTNKINYMIVPLAILDGSKIFANAAIIIYGMNQNAFFEFLKIISDEKTTIESKEELINIAKNISGVNIEIFKEFLNKEIFNDYLDNNLQIAKELIKPLQIPVFYLNGSLINAKDLISKIEELLSYRKDNETTNQ